MDQPSRVVTRSAESRDLLAIAEFQTATWNEAYRGLVPQDYLDRTTVADRELRWAGRIGRRRILLAEFAGRLVGVASSSLRDDDRPGPTLELNTLYVAAGMRRSGLGTRLLSEVLDDQPAVVWVFAANLRGIRFYERCGFAADGESAVDDGTGLAEVRLTRSA